MISLTISDVNNLSDREREILNIIIAPSNVEQSDKNSSPITLEVNENNIDKVKEIFSAPNEIKQDENTYTPTKKAIESTQKQRKKPGPKSKVKNPGDAPGKESFEIPTPYDHQGKPITKPTEVPELPEHSHNFIGVLPPPPPFVVTKITFPQLVKKITDLRAKELLTTMQLNEIIISLGVDSLPLLAARPELFESVDAAIDFSVGEKK